MLSKSGPQIPQTASLSLALGQIRHIPEQLIPNKLGLIKSSRVAYSDTHLMLVVSHSWGFPIHLHKAGQGGPPLLAMFSLHHPFFITQGAKESSLSEGDFNWTCFPQCTIRINSLSSSQIIPFSTKSMSPIFLTQGLPSQGSVCPLLWCSFNLLESMKSSTVSIYLLAIRKKCLYNLFSVKVSSFSY